ncbi:MAG: lytic transglycosylase domain-containing protein [Thermodesulfobacteriota bacterium]
MSLERQKGLPAFCAELPLAGSMPYDLSLFREKAVPEIKQEIWPEQPKGQEIDGIIQEASARFGVDPDLIKAVITVESNGNPRAVSPAGAQGLMQLMPGTAAELGVTDPFNSRQNIMAGTRYLSRLLDRYQGNRSLALAAYNWGMGNLEKNPKGLPRETRNYIVRVEKKLQTYAENSSPA